MSGKLRLGPLPRTELVRLTFALPATVKADLDRYAELYGSAYGELVDAATLVPHMLAAFMERDRAFRKARQAAPAGSQLDRDPAATETATSKTHDTAVDGSPSR